MGKFVLKVKFYRKVAILQLFKCFIQLDLRLILRFCSMTATKISVDSYLIS